jgi:hypothetical protein
VNQTYLRGFSGDEKSIATINSAVEIDETDDDATATLAIVGEHTISDTQAGS